MYKYYITGVSGVGKSAVIKELKRRGVAAFDIDEEKNLCRWRHKKTGEKAEYQYGIGREWLEAHDYVCDPMKLKKLMNRYQGKVIVAGLASNQDEFLDLFDKVFLLHCSEKTFLNRLKTRKTNEFAREKSEQEHILSWYKDFEEKMLRLGVVPIGTEKSLETVVDCIVSEMQFKSESK